MVKSTTTMPTQVPVCQILTLLLKGKPITLMRMETEHSLVNEVIETPSQ